MLESDSGSSLEDEFTSAMEGTSAAEQNFLRWRETTLAEIMSGVILAAKESDSVRELWRRMEERGVSGAPIVDDTQRPVGVVSKTDVLRALFETGAGKNPASTAALRVGDIMTPPAFALPKHAMVSRAAALLAYEGVHRVIVVNDTGAVVGVVTSLDVARWVSECAGFNVAPYTQRQRVAQAAQDQPGHGERAAIDPFNARLRRIFDPEAADRVERLCRRLLNRPQPGDDGMLRVVRGLVAQRAEYQAIVCLLLVYLQRTGRSDEKHLYEFGGEVVEMVKVSRSLTPLRTDTTANWATDLSSLLTAVVSDSRVLLVRTALRVAELEQVLEESKRGDARVRALARETHDVYVPIAGALGLAGLRRQLEDLSFRVLEPEAYAALAADIEPLRSRDEECIELLRLGVERLLRRNRLGGEVTGRSKGLFSLYRKMKTASRSLEAIMDKLGLRIVVETVPDCYAVLGLLHSHFRPIPGTFDDYIALPKSNGYRSLHTCVYPLRDVSDKPVEFQIRTRQMHDEAEFGIAAHWRYKRDGSLPDYQSRHRAWFTQACEESRTCDPDEFVERLRRRVFDDEIVVFLEHGQSIRLPAGTTVAELGRHLAGGPEVATVLVDGSTRSPSEVLVDGASVRVVARGAMPAP